MAENAVFGKEGIEFVSEKRSVSLFKVLERGCGRKLLSRSFPPDVPPKKNEKEGQNGKAFAPVLPLGAPDKACHGGPCGNSFRLTFRIQPDVS